MGGRVTRLLDKIKAKRGGAPTAVAVAVLDSA